MYIKTPYQTSRVKSFPHSRLSNMMFGTAVSLVVCVLLMNTLGAELSGEARGRRHYCGKHLATALSVVCDGWYKRSSANYVDTEDPSEQIEYMYVPFLNKQSALSMPRTAYKWRNKRAGIVDECCKQSCTVAELRQYCGTEDD